MHKRKPVYYPLQLKTLELVLNYTADCREEMTAWGRVIVSCNVLWSTTCIEVNIFISSCYYRVVSQATLLECVLGQLSP
jgi:hypothetical protein